MWKSGINRAKNGVIRPEDDLTNQIKEFFEGQEQVEKYDIVDVKNWVVDVEGSILLFESDLADGELFFKIGKLTGNLYCHCRHFKPSVVPTELGGEVVFVLDEEELAKYRTNTIGNANDDDPFQEMQLITTKEPSKSNIKTSIIKRLKTAIADSIDYEIDIDFDKLLAEVREEQKNNNTDKYKLHIKLKTRSTGNIECRIYLWDVEDEQEEKKGQKYGKDELKLTATQKAIYLMFIMEKEGLVIDDISVANWKTAKKIYDKLYGRVEKVFEEKNSDKLYTNGISNKPFATERIRENLSYIRSAIKEKVSYREVIQFFAVEGEKNQAFKVQAATDEIREQIRQAFGL